MSILELQNGESGALIRAKINQAIALINQLQLDFANFTQADWDELIGKPSDFPPSAHTHFWSHIANPPSEFPPSAHTHPWAQITNQPNLPIAKIKTLSESAASTTTVQPDDVLNFPVTAGKSYFVILYVQGTKANDNSRPLTAAISGGSASGMAIGISSVTGNVNGLAIADFAQSTQIGFLTTNTIWAAVAFVHFTAIVDDTFSFNWAQGVANTTPTIITKGALIAYGF